MGFERSSGILLHVTSLAGKYGIGDLGKAANNFVDFLFESKQKLWQILPTGPTGYGNSPYQTFSAFAGNPLFIDLDDLIARDLLTKNDLQTDLQFNNTKVEFDKVRQFKDNILQKAFMSFDLNNNEFKKFIDQKSWWLDDYTSFIAAKETFAGKSWDMWDDALRFHERHAINSLNEKFSNRINYHKFCQFLFFDQWLSLKKYANDKGVKIIGDIPIFISADSADAWANPEIFQFDENNLPIKIAGVPPDYFCETGQLWGNPLYDWEALEEQKFNWWLKRFRSTMQLVDITRVDHFRGFVACWAVPAGEETAINGEWEKAPGEKLFSVLLSKLGNLPVIAEDLGLITQEVNDLRDKFNFPGMKILQFAFDSDLDNDYLPHNYSENCVVYTGTHDNETTLGWYKNSPESRKKLIKTYLQKDNFDICSEMVELAWRSPANTAIAPLQDFLCLDNTAKMNTPGKAEGNWCWRVDQKLLTSNLVKKIKDITIQYNR